ncbi:hypothetical protein CSIM01_00236 [Colletotrichum simmondsii]|uniref:Uncharacterized protein n=1 Tax=Colletotrichum simmondsii TaxID=703756 RepID=A0A135SEL2_9PEZI|nr:hypothetical protein CSIM01_00236 [Colletotrichum simmondsii]
MQVAGEIPSFKVLKRGTIWAVGIVGGLYLFIVTIVGHAFTWKDGKLDQSYKLENYVAVFLNVTNSHNVTDSHNATFVEQERSKVLRHEEKVSVAAAVLISISAIGSMISVTYTCVRVKQSIGWTNILPWSRLLRRSGPLRPGYQRLRQNQGNDESTVRLTLPDENPFSYLGTPEGGIVAHWIMTVFYICVTAAITPLSKAISLSANLLVYGHFFIEALVGLGFTWFKPVDPRPRPRGYPAIGWFPNGIPERPPKWMRRSYYSSSIDWVQNGIFQIALGLGTMLTSLVLIVLDAYTGEDSEHWDFLNFYVTAGLLLLASFYWFFFVRARPHSEVTRATLPSERLYECFGRHLELSTHGLDDINDPEMICSFCARFQGTEMELLSQDHMRSHDNESRHPAAHRHPHYGYLHFISTNAFMY